MGPQPLLVKHFGSKRTDLWVEPPGLFEEQAAVIRNGLSSVQHVLQGRHVCTIGMDALLGLIELLRVAEKDEVSRGLRHSQYIREGHLSGFVHERTSTASKNSWRAHSHAVPPATGASPPYLFRLARQSVFASFRTFRPSLRLHPEILIPILHRLGWADARNP